MNFTTDITKIDAYRVRTEEIRGEHYIIDIIPDPNKPGEAEAYLRGKSTGMQTHLHSSCTVDPEYKFSHSDIMDIVKRMLGYAMDWPERERQREKFMNGIHRKIERNSDIQLAFTEWSYYQAGMLDIYYQLYDAGIFTFAHIADAMHLDKSLIEDAYPIWKNGEIVQRGGLMQELLLQQVDLDGWKQRAAYSAALLLDILHEDEEEKVK